jgi:hypothetical protein
MNISVDQPRILLTSDAFGDTEYAFRISIYHSIEQETKRQSEFHANVNLNRDNRKTERQIRPDSEVLFSGVWDEINLRNLPHISAAVLHLPEIPSVVNET